MAARFHGERDFILGLSATSADLGRDVDAAHKLLALATLTKVVLKTPVDNGEARGGWQYSIGAPADGAPARNDTAGGATIAAESAKVSAVRGFVRSFITNSVPHAVVLDQGGYVPRDPSTAPDALARRAAGRNRGQRTRAEQLGGHPGTPFVAGGYSLQAPEGMVAVSVEELRVEFGLR